MLTKAKVLEIIENAFADVLFPGPQHKSLMQAEAWDNYEVCDQSNDYKGKWQNLPLEQIENCQWALPHLDEFGFQFYLPAIMSTILHCDEKDNSLDIVKDSLLFNLSKQESPSLEEYQKKRLSLFSIKQKNAVLQFLKYIAPEESHLVEYWERIVKN